MSREWQPGDVVTATVMGRPNVRLVAGWSKYEPRLRWCEMSPRWGDGDDDDCWFTPLQVTDARPLVVIDPEDAEQVERLTSILSWALAPSDAAQLADALREFADPKPPKPDEPTGLGAVVRDTADELWIRTCDPCDDCLNKPWQRGPVHKNWQIVDAIEVLTDGYDQGSGEPLADWERDLLRGQS